MASDNGYRSKLSYESAPETLERFLRYVRIDTQANPILDNRPEHRQTTRTFSASRRGAEGDRAHGRRERRTRGYVMTTLPATVECEVPAIASLAHVGVTSDAGTGMGTIQHERRRMP